MPRRFAVGDQVCIRAGRNPLSLQETWPRFRGRTGAVIMVNRDEYGVAFGTVGHRADGSPKSGNVVWFKSYEMRRLAAEKA